MWRTGTSIGIIAAIAFAACGDKDPISATPREGDGPPTENGNNGIAPGEPHPDGAIQKLERPALLVIDNLDDAKQLLNWFPRADVEEMLAGIDFASNRLVVAVRGRMNTAGFEIEIQGISASAEFIEITVALTDPDPDGATAQVITYPYDLTVVGIDDVAEYAGAIWVMQTTDGDILARTGDGMPQKIDIRGHITDVELVESDGRGALSVVRIEGVLEDDTNFDKAVVTVTSETRILLLDGDEIRPLDVRELAMGQPVEALHRTGHGILPGSGQSRNYRCDSVAS